MPTYEYSCKRCGETLEVFQSFSDKPLRTHECGGELQKVFHSRGVVFKGSGFYRTDSRSASTSKSDKDTKSKSKKPESPKPDSSSTVTASAD